MGQVEMRSMQPDVKARERWIDVAKGIAIILVVLLHSSFDYLDDSHVWRWEDYSSILETFRMPLFFFTAGIFASGALSKSLRVLINSRVLRFVWLYILWSLVSLTIFSPLMFGFPGVGQFLLQVVSIVFIPLGETWFIYAMALYFSVAWLLRRLHLWIQLTIGVALALFFHSGLLTPSYSEWAKVGEYFLFFLLAVEFGPKLRRIVPLLSWWHTLVAPAVYVVALLVLRHLGWVDAGEGSVKAQLSWTILSFLAVAAGCSIAILLARWALFDWLYWLGSRTLQVYLLHWYLLAVAWFLVAQVSEFPPPIAPFVVPLLAAFAICGSLFVHHLTRRATFLYAKPEWLNIDGRRSKGSSVG